ncbi:uncharacterized protein LOC133805904 [Humulus lupulus]|uniref:uncharacterized protein LOC133805904 n=1 Tax=Humulus lupulus TaxID=3486 RepID=UPI002B408FBB|nr:uncharacterized protein LOC133805904 [Humulus lupulus]
MGNLNKTRVVLIPKVTHLTKVTDFRLISLCNVITKAIANRFKTALLMVISDTQSAFVPVRLMSISDNTIMAFEFLHSLKKRSNGENGWMSVKLDMSKAYDRVEWIFLNDMIEAMGFCGQWRELVLRCIKNPQVSFIVNEVNRGCVISDRGL